MKRKECVFCGAKRNVNNLILIESRLLRKKGWVCKHHPSEIPDIGNIKVATKKPVFVELFSGSGHISQEAEKRGYETVTVDFEKKFKPDIVADIERLKYTSLPQNVAVVWVSVPCYVHSVLSIAHHWNAISIGWRQYYYVPKTKEAIQALRILNKALRLIKKMNPIFFFIENPRGALRHMPQMVFMPYRKTVSYSDYGFDVYKPTDIWTNCKAFRPKEITTAVGKEFKQKIQGQGNNYTRSLVPPDLINYVLDSISILEPKKEKQVPGIVEANS